MNIYCFSHYDLLRPTTNRISDIRFCEGFAENGCHVELIVPYVYRSYNIEKSRIFEMYGIRHTFNVNMLPAPFWDGMPGKLQSMIWLVLVAWHYLRILRDQRENSQLVYVVSRDVNTLLPILLINRLLPTSSRARVVHWAHDVKLDRESYRWVYRKADGIIGTNSAITSDIASELALPAEKMAVSLNPVSTRQVSQRLDKNTVRQKLHLQSEAPLIVYTGKVGPGVKEISYILQAAARLNEYIFLFTGGKPQAVDFYEAYCERNGIVNAVFTGFLNDYTQVMNYQVAADVLVSYYTADDHLVHYNYPQKITEYMLAGRPIVTPNYPATRDVLNERNAIFVEPEDPEALAEGIRRAVEDKELAANVTMQALEDVREITFQKRTKLLMKFFQSL